MKEELSGKLVEILTSIQTSVGQAKDFAMDQLPDIAHSYIMYGMAVETIQQIIFLSLFILFGWIGCKFGFFSESKDRWGGITESRIACIFFSIIGMLTFGFCFVIKLNSFLLVWFAPKVWLLKEISSLIN